jgi:hypothetical protein
MFDFGPPAGVSSRSGATLTSPVLVLSKALNRHATLGATRLVCYQTRNPSADEGASLSSALPSYSAQALINKKLPAQSRGCQACY